jgi:hypothetical protein
VKVCIKGTYWSTAGDLNPIYQQSPFIVVISRYWSIFQKKNSFFSFCPIHRYLESLNQKITKDSVPQNIIFKPFGSSTFTIEISLKMERVSSSYVLFFGLFQQFFDSLDKFLTWEDLFHRDYQTISGEILKGDASHKVKIAVPILRESS